MALHHFGLAREQQKRSEASGHLQSIDYEAITKDVQSSAAKDLKSRFERVSPDLFFKLFSFADATSLVRSTSVSKAWKQSIHGSSELFRNFRMEGKGQEMFKGLRLFSKRSQDSIRRMELRDNPPLHLLKTLPRLAL